MNDIVNDKDYNFVLWMTLGMTLWMTKRVAMTAFLKNQKDYLFHAVSNQYLNVSAESWPCETNEETKLHKILGVAHAHKTQWNTS